MFYNYFKLQFKLLNRKIKDFGISPQLGYPIFIIIFYYISTTILEKHHLGKYAYSLIGLIYLYKLSDYKRNEFLFQTFRTKQYILIRILENTLIQLPFIIFLIIKNHYLLVLFNSLIAIGFTFIKIKSSNGFVIPTPFSKKPFEFSVGFRKSYYLFPILLGLPFIAAKVNNPNLALAAIIGTIAIASTFYSNPETDYFVWIYNKSPKMFLKLKMINGFKNTVALSLPVLLLSSYLFYNSLDQIALVYGISLAFICLMILIKYAAFPNKIDLPQYIILSVCIYLPPLLLLVFPYFYKQALQKLKNYLV